LDPSESCDAQRFRELALPVIDAIASRGQWPIVVGGSGLYMKALTHGLSSLPKGDEALRARLALLTAEERVAELLRLDPEAGRNVPLKNDRYVSRALEICLLTGRAQSELRSEWLENTPEFMGVQITRDRDDLYNRINERVNRMVAAGLVEEVASSGVLSSTAEKAIGVREVRQHLNEGLPLAAVVAAIQQASRRYAKRQITWFKREQGFQTICLSPDSTASMAADRIIELFPCLNHPPPPALSSST
ncbi:MAG: miaa: trna dimethylallyltransferase, partial [Verrucomicrobiaceae bacterium]|nr:miaa: trna dimethylallyltransferase [Verrucomicrobiaceae bacterium]